MKKEIEEIIENLEFLISEDCTDTQFDYVGDIENAIEIIKIIKNAAMSNSRLTEICEAEREGRLHIAPIADGTTIWYFAEDEDDITNIYESTYLYGVCEYHVGELGVNVFLTYEEAEKALAEREDIK